MLHEMETKAFPVDGVGSNERNKNNRKTKFKCPFIKSIISSYFFSVEAEAKMINFLQKVFLFCCFFLKSAEIQKTNETAAFWTDVETKIFSGTLNFQSPGHHLRTSKHRRSFATWFFFIIAEKNYYLFSEHLSPTFARRYCSLLFALFHGREKQEAGNNGEKH